MELTPTAPKVRQVLAFLLVRCGKLVQVGELIDELWGDEPPASAMTTLQTYIYKLRKDVLDRCTSATLHTRVSGYLLDVSAERGDLLRFERLAHEGRTALDEGDAARAADRLCEALALWRGPALADVSAGEILSAHVTRVEEERLRTLELRITADLELGRHRQLISELKMLVSEHPLNERFHSHLMVALHRSGRRYEALEVYQGLRRMLIDELGMEPSAAVQQLHLNLLSSDAESREGAPAPAVRGRFETLLVPAQLPPDTSDFVGREEILRDVRRHLVRPRGENTAARAVSISGMPGVGKSALALRAGHADRVEFPDGQLYADLRGATERPTDPHQILEGFARAIGVPAAEIPDSLQERSKLFRTWSMGRRVLVVLDDAHSVSQVAPLLPASPNCAVIITTQRGLYSLPGVRHVELEVMTVHSAMALIEAVSGRRFTADELGATERLARLAGRLPLALRAVGSRLAAMQTWPVEKLAAQIEGLPRRLDPLSFAELDVRARLAAGYRRLAPGDRSALRLISLLPPPDFTATTAARLIGSGTDAVEAQLIRLAGYHLLSVSQGGGGEIRYRLHELVRMFARERLDEELLNPVRDRPEPSTVAAHDHAPAVRDGVRPGRENGHPLRESGGERPDRGYEHLESQVVRATAPPEPPARRARPVNGVVKALGSG
ncbi:MULTISPECIES: AfsR/SARP family transcriptional regulator [Thermomonosporaceae]|uniref:AfsR/SARP family transcriptional regulator n=1 Tax=Thermomonosporaceae TaxID=2012 RepID=UPI00255A8245|nr:MULTISPECIES: AfsR/SARP family transcriptional regulator [Thermomonosporaceae]MDL4774136.1 AfsR/SARP family transcriptional regulator [Actinomadura xylanilytica]